jgi:hypothetical protein
MALGAWHLPAGHGRRHLLPKAALVAKKASPIRVVSLRRIFTHDNGMPAFRTRHCLAGMTVFNLYGISAFIAVKNHPASSPEPRKPSIPTPVIDQNEKILHNIFIEIAKKPDHNGLLLQWLNSERVIAAEAAPTNNRDIRPGRSGFSRDSYHHLCICNRRSNLL